MSASFEEEKVKDGIFKFTLCGTLDAPGTMVIEDEFRSRVSAAGGRVIVDLLGVDYISSYGLRMLLVGARAVNNLDGMLSLAGANENVMQMIRVAGYETILPVYATVEEAVASLSA
jgi:anti-anti-sigma factor